jgi:hypothetical protein
LQLVAPACEIRVTSTRTLNQGVLAGSTGLSLTLLAPGSVRAQRGMITPARATVAPAHPR